MDAIGQRRFVQTDLSEADPSTWGPICNEALITADTNRRMGAERFAFIYSSSRGKAN